MKKKRLVNTIYAYNMDLKDPGLFMFIAVANEGISALEIEKNEILDIIAQIKKVMFHKKILKIKNQYKS